MGSHSVDNSDEKTKLLSQHPAEDSEEDSEKKLVKASVLCFIFMVVELVGGYLSGSLAVMSDAAHLLSDLAGFAISLIAVRVGKIPGDSGMSYGYARSEVIGALVSTVFIWLLAIVLSYFAVQRLFHPEAVNGPMMFLLGFIGLAVNFVLGVVLGAESILHGGHGHGSHDSHDNHDNHDDHDASDVESGEPHEHGGGLAALRGIFFGENFANVNVRAAYVHVLGDLVQNIGVMIAAAIIWINPSWQFMDPICTIQFAFLVVWTTMGVAKDSINVLMEGTPNGLNMAKIYDSLIKVEGVVGVADLHVWSLTIGQPAMSVHLNTFLKDQHPVLKGAQKALNDKFGVIHATIQVNCTTGECCQRDEYGGTMCVREATMS
uniref:Cation efflux protein cytoplasmic domain-containing protein n=1 Tax=Rhodosorus marinus TaxID=101924 RepID=A0A7S0BSU3_9RHOD|mmetsp:Transcript_6250/g.8847  ORF Transcript_6250/g.8847 Transcript_6250/m.8847 type:complete len:376 (+) Transcript_6250:359-1486(+)